MSQAEASEIILGRKDSSFFQSLRRGSTPSVTKFAKACEALGVSFTFGPKSSSDDLYYGSANTDSAPAISPDRMRDMETEAHALVRVIHESGGDPIPADLRSILCGERVSEPAPPALSVDDALPQPPPVLSVVSNLEDDTARGPGRHVDVVELAPAAGHGSFIEGAERRGSITFQRKWLDRHGLNPTECVVIQVTGKSMEPTLTAGCSILVNRASRDRRTGRIFVVYMESGLVVKRLKKQADGWLLASDNPEWPTVSWPREGDCWIEGEVRWMAKTLP